jgi:uncharacterized protein YdaU (DUF1376 family)
MASFPAFLFYPEDFATGTAHMPPLAVGVYIRCLCHQWSHGFIPNDQKQIARITGAMLDEIGEAWPLVADKFSVAEPGKLKNRRLEDVRAELLRVSKKRSRSGKLGAQSRWGDSKRHSNANGKRMANAKQSDNKTIASRVEDEDETEDANDSESKSGSGQKISAVVSHYQTYHPRAKAGRQERGKISARLGEGFSVDDLKLAIDGCHVSKFHGGDNDRGAKYQALELIVRDASKVTQFIELAGNEGGPQLSERSRRSIAAIRQFTGDTNGIS